MDKATHKNIVVLSDGTGNSSGKLSRTNVWRVYESLDLADPPNPAHPRQFALYDNGVGTSSFRPFAILSGAFGFGLARNVRDLYSFICRVYEPGDQIYAFGFSRGAFTIRVLVALILSQGLVPYKDENEGELKRLAKAAYRAYRAGLAKSRNFPSDKFIAPAGRWLRDKFISMQEGLSGKKPYKDVPKTVFDNQGEPIRIRFVGLWDTVDAYGMPVDEMLRAIDQYIWPLTMRENRIDERVERFVHALSIDDERNTFHPRLIDETGEPLKGKIQDERISQVWFAGVHSNVGGGYPDDGLAYVPMKWVIREAQRCKLRFSRPLLRRLYQLEDENGPIYDSRKGLAGYYRFNPRRIEWITKANRVRLNRVKIHESVLRRIQVGQDGYAPIVLSEDFHVARIEGDIVTGADYLSGKYVKPPHLVTRQSVDISATSAYAEQRERVWNWVWWRRVMYFFTLFVTLLILFSPIFLSADQACQSKLCFIPSLVESLVAFLPSWTATWTAVFNANPDWFTAMLVLVGLGLYSGSLLEQHIHDQMRKVWYQFDTTRPNSVLPYRPPLTAGAINRFVQWLRLTRAYRRGLRALTHGILPFGFAVGMVLLGAAVIWRTIFAMGDSAGYVCTGNKNPQSVATMKMGEAFLTSKVCHPTGLELEEGATYRLYIKIPDQAPWTDRGIPAGPNGLAVPQQWPGLKEFISKFSSIWDTRGTQDNAVKPTRAPWYLSLMVPLRRHWTSRWYMPMARIGIKGTDQYELKPLPAIAYGPDLVAGRAQTGAPAFPQFDSKVPGVTYTAELVARSSGELFMYVNDATLPPLWSLSRITQLYENNSGMAYIAVERVRPRPWPEGKP